jgi:starch phosphorylase
MKYIISIIPEIALEGVPFYAGGLGILEGDKFIEASRLNLPYIVLTLFYPEGYINYIFINNEIKEEFFNYNYIENYLEKKEKFLINTKLGSVEIQPLSFKSNTAEVIFFKVLSPEWAVRATKRVYIEDDRFQYEYKYIILAKAALKYIYDFIGLENIEIIDVQESLAGLALLKLSNKVKLRFTIHTPGPWGHPTFSSKLLEEEFEVRFKDENIILTRALIDIADSVITVSSKHEKITAMSFPDSIKKISHVTNGVSLTRWMNEHMKKFYISEVLNFKNFIKARNESKKDLMKFLKKYKKIDSFRPIVVWARRVTRYKRPYFIIRFIREVGKDLNVIFVLGGKSHPRDYEGKDFMREFYNLSKEYNNVIYINDYSLDNSIYILSGSDLLLFTPFSGWEACGTSYMKAGINGVPTLASKDGGTLEIIQEGINGWFFGKDLRELIDIYSERAYRIDEQDYVEFKSKLLYIIDKIENDKEGYYEIMLNTFLSYIKWADIKRVLRDLYFYNI